GLWHRARPRPTRPVVGAAPHRGSAVCRRRPSAARPPPAAAAGGQPPFFPLPDGHRLRILLRSTLSCAWLSASLRAPGHPPTICDGRGKGETAGGLLGRCLSATAAGTGASGRQIPIGGSKLRRRFRW